MRVVAGSARGRPLVAPAGLATRPTTDRAREAVFNALHSVCALSGARVLDCFAGSGALGIEALSRGAATATFVDDDAAARRAVQQNLASIDATGRGVVLARRAEQVLAEWASEGLTFDLVLLDPPYDFARWPELLAAVAEVVSPTAVVVMESDREVEIDGDLTLEVTRTKRYGGTVVTFARPLGAGP